MPVSVVVGGQFGSEGKGKTALDISRRFRAAAVVRTGGTNSGHTAIGDDGRTYALRQLPAAALYPNCLIILPPGALIDPDIFLREIDLLGLGPARVCVDPNATLIDATDKEHETKIGLIDAIGSTGSGTGAALQRRLSRLASDVPILAGDCPTLAPFCRDTIGILRTLLDRGERVVIEGTQGFGLSLLHGGFYPKATSRDTTAAAFIGEAGLSPRDVDHIVLVIRSYPIRVAGDSGRLENETTWDDVAKEAGLPEGYCELTTATKKVRRVARFDPEIVRRAIAVNQPHEIVLNHLDYIDRTLGARASGFVGRVEHDIGQAVVWVGNGPGSLEPRTHLADAGATGLASDRSEPSNLCA